MEQQLEIINEKAQKEEMNISKKSLKQYKNIIALTALLLGGQIGVGYASGREVVTFFGDYGWFNIILFLILITGYATLLITYSKLARRIDANNITDVTKIVFGKFYFVANALLLISIFSGLSATIAGLDSIANNVFTNYSFPWLSILISMIVVLIVSSGMKGVLKAASVIVPVLIITLFLTIFYFLIFGAHQTVTIAPMNASSMGLGVLSALFYVGSNLNTSSVLMTQLTKKFSEIQLKWASVLFATFFSLGIGLIVITLYQSSNTIFASDLPMSHIASSISSAFGVLYNIILFVAMTMTITAISFTLTNWFEKYFKHNFYAVVAVIALGFLVSRLGFSAIIDYIYPVKGFGGLFVGVMVLIYYLKNKNKTFKQNKK